MADNSRQFPRYDVHNLPSFAGKIDKKDSTKTLVTIGLGGCGFMSEVDDVKYHPPRRAFCQFEVEFEKAKTPLSIEVQGNIVYLKPVKLESKTIFFYGVEFLEIHRPLLKPIFEYLEGLAKDGQIKCSI